MNRNAFFDEIMPSEFKLTQTLNESGPDSLKVHDGTKNAKLKDIKFIKRIAREKMRLNGAPIKYFPIDVDSIDRDKRLDYDNILGDHTEVELLAPIAMIATWTPQEYQMDLSKWGVIMPLGSDQQIYIHVDELEEKLGRKPQIGDIIETVRDVTRYKVTDVFFGHSNLWENIFCMITLSKANYDNYTEQLKKYDSVDENYEATYTQLATILNVMDGKEEIYGNVELKEQKKKTEFTKKPKKRSLDSELDIMTMRL